MQNTNPSTPNTLHKLLSDTKLMAYAAVWVDTGEGQGEARGGLPPKASVLIWKS